MKLLQILIKSKNKKSILKFLIFLNKNSIKKKNQKKIKNQIITILKSPHVNKKAQEQFKKEIIKAVVRIESKKIFQHLIFLKKLKLNFLSDIQILLKYTINNNFDKKLNSIFLNKKNFKIKKYISFNQKNYQFIKRFFFFSNTIILFFKIFDCYGECFKKRLTGIKHASFLFFN